VNYGAIVHHVVCLFTPKLSLVAYSLHNNLCLYPRRDGQGGLTWVIGNIQRWFYRSLDRPEAVSHPVAYSRLDYGNATLAGVSSHLLSRLQSVMNAAARLIFSSSKFRHITPLLRQLHWLKAPERIAFKYSNMQSLCTSVSTGLHLHTLSTSFVRWQMSRLVSDFVPVHPDH